VYHAYMKPRIAICNIFDQDADRLLDFAALNDFEGIDWTIGKGQSEKAFVSQMEKLRGLEVRFHCAFPGIDFAYADSRSERSMEVLTQTIKRIALIGRRHLTVHTGFGHVSAGELDLKKATIESLDRALAYAIEEITTDETILFVVTADHSTASTGRMIHSGETVPLTMVGKYTRRDDVNKFNEVNCAGGALGPVRGKELMYLILNFLDRGKLWGLMDSPVNQPFYPGNYKPLLIDRTS